MINTTQTAIKLAEKNGAKVGQVWRYKLFPGETIGEQTVPTLISRTMPSGISQQPIAHKTEFFNGEYMINSQADLERFALGVSDHWDRVKLVDKEEDARIAKAREEEELVKRLKSLGFPDSKIALLLKEKEEVEDAEIVTKSKK